MTPLDLLSADVLSDWPYLLVWTLALVATALSALMPYHAYGGYRRNGSRPMLFLAVGFAFITVLPFFVEILSFVVVARLYSGRVVSVVIPSIEYAIRVVGLAFVLYSLYGRRPSDDPQAGTTGD